MRECCGDGRGKDVADPARGHVDAEESGRELRDVVFKPIQYPKNEPPEVEAKYALATGLTKLIQRLNQPLLNAP